MDCPVLIKMSSIETEVKRSGNHLFGILGQLSALRSMNNSCYFAKQSMYVVPKQTGLSNSNNRLSNSGKYVPRGLACRQYTHGVKHTTDRLPERRHDSLSSCKEGPFVEEGLANLMTHSSSSVQSIPSSFNPTDLLWEKTVVQREKDDFQCHLYCITLGVTTPTVSYGKETPGVPLTLEMRVMVLPESCNGGARVTSEIMQLFGDRTRIRNSYLQPLWLTTILPHKKMGGGTKGNGAFRIKPQFLPSLTPCTLNTRRDTAGVPQTILRYIYYKENCRNQRQPTDQNNFKKIKDALHRCKIFNSLCPKTTDESKSQHCTCITPQPDWSPPQRREAKGFIITAVMCVC